MAEKQPTRKRASPKTRHPSFAKANIISALKDNAGMVVTAARALGCSPNLIYRALQKYPDVAAARKEAQEFSLDQAQTQLSKAVERGEPWAVSLTLKTLGRSRGFIERSEHAVTGDLKTDIVVNMVK